MDKEKIIGWLEAGISLESVVKEMVKSTGDSDFEKRVNRLLELQQYPDKEKDLDFKQYTLNKKFEMLDDHYKLSPNDEEYIMMLGNKYLSTLTRLVNKIGDNK